MPRARWDFKEAGPLWTRAAMSAVATHGAVLTQIVPRDIETWCPAYTAASETERRAFWVGMMSALSKHESTYNPRAVGGGDLWYGLLQIYPDTARRYDCRARSGEALKNAADNLSCAARIMAVTVARDRAVAMHDGRWRGVAADWGPMTNRGKINDMAAWTRAQSYCALMNDQRPVARPNLPVAVSTMTVTPQPD
ncbi:MAG: transglycosylase SLT domain-containing protein [Pseudomonadota bacterium]